MNQNTTSTYNSSHPISSALKNSNSSSMRMGGGGVNDDVTAVTASRRNMILCCLCGTKIYPNAANQCGSCLAQQFDLNSIVRKGPSGNPLTIHQCRKCRKYERTATNHIHMDPESPELLSLLLKKIPALQESHPHHTPHTSNSSSLAISHLKLIDASWVWTEPNSMRLKLRLTIRADIDCSPGTTQIQQRVLVEFIVKFHQCPECNREFTRRTWHAVVQLRQKPSKKSDTSQTHKHGLRTIESVIAQHADMRKHVLRIVTAKYGFDFYFWQYAHAQQFASFLGKMAPLKTKLSKKMVSEDVKNNTANMKYTIVADMVPLNRHDLVLCSNQYYRGEDGGGGFASSWGSFGLGPLEGRMALVTKVTSCVHFVDAAPIRSSQLSHIFADLKPDKYWKGGGDKRLQVILSSQQLVRFVVLDVELCKEQDWKRPHQYQYQKKKQSNQNDTLPVEEQQQLLQLQQHALYEGPQSGVEKYALADVEVIRESDFGTDQSFRCVTHLGNLLQYGDIVLGYDLTTSVLPDELQHTTTSDSTFSSSPSSSRKSTTNTNITTTTTTTTTTNNKSSGLNNNFILPDVVLVKKCKDSIGDDDVHQDIDTSLSSSSSSTPTYSSKKMTRKEKRAKAKSSSSKRRERRRRKQEQKELELEQTAARMGFGQEEEEKEDQDDNHHHYNNNDTLKYQLETTMEKIEEEDGQQGKEDLDVGLQTDLELIEQEMKLAGTTIDP